MTVEPADKFEISPVVPSLWAEALELVVQHLPSEDRGLHVDSLLADAAQRPEVLDGLLGVHCGGQLVASGLAQVLPGRAVVVWPPRARTGTSDQTVAALFEALDAFARQHEAQIVQALLSENQDGDAVLLGKAGFQHVTDLVFLVASEEDFPASLPITPLIFETYSPDNHDRMARIVEKTYVGTRDCPAMNGIREVEDVLEGYRATGTFSPSRWLIVRAGREDVGCLLLADHPATDQWELVYMGLDPAARGNSYGSHIVLRAQWMARRAGRKRLVLAVDMANRPALRIYEAARFVAWERRHVYMKILE